MFKELSDSGAKDIKTEEYQSIAMMWNFFDKIVQRVKGIWVGICEIECRNKGVGSLKGAELEKDSVTRNRGQHL